MVKHGPSNKVDEAGNSTWTGEYFEMYKSNILAGDASN